MMMMRRRRMRMMIMMMILRMRMTTILMIIMASSGLGGRWTIDIKYNDDDYEDGIDNNFDDIIIKLWPGGRPGAS